MSSPFSQSIFTSRPTWSKTQVPNGGFSAIQGLHREVGYGMGGFGVDGYDTPTYILPPAPVPNWTKETTK